MNTGSGQVGEAERSHQPGI